MPESAAAPQLPEDFIARLKEIIPETNDTWLYQLLASDNPYSHDVLVHLEGQIRYLASELDSDQRAELDSLLVEWKSGYTPPPVIGTVELYLTPRQTDQ